MLNATKRQTAAFLVSLHGLDARTRDVDSVFARLGSVQYDPLDVAGRNADLVLFARVAGYERATLERLLYGERTLVDGWDKMMCVYPVSDWASFARVRAHRAECARWILEYRHSSEALAFRDDALAHLSARGPSRAADMKFGRAGDGGSWGHRSVAGAALDALFHEGKVCVAGKKGAQKTYDLAERLLGPDILGARDPFADEPAFREWLVMRRIGSVGLLWNRNGVLWQGMCPPLERREYRRTLIDSLVDRGLLAEVRVEGIDEPLWLRAEDALALERVIRSTAAGTPADDCAPVEARFLAPLDNLLWDRELVEAIFGIRYRWEVYTPAAKREYGYYVLPILCGSRFVGRFEPVLDRKTNTLEIKNVWYEDGDGESVGTRDNKHRETIRALVSEGVRAAINAELGRFAAFLGAERVIGVSF